MLSATRPHPIPTLAVLIGMAVFVIGLLASLSRAANPPAFAQEECLQPAGSGCAMQLGVPVGAPLIDWSVPHNWLLGMPNGNNFTVALIAPPADYRLSVYGPDGAVIGVTDNPGIQDEVIPVAAAGAGVYWIVVDSPSGEWSIAPYFLIATASTAETPVSFDSYGVPPPAPRPFHPYR